MQEKGGGRGGREGELAEIETPVVWSNGPMVCLCSGEMVSSGLELCNNQCCFQYKATLSEPREHGQARGRGQAMHGPVILTGNARQSVCR